MLRAAGSPGSSAMLEYSSNKIIVLILFAAAAALVAIGALI